MNTLTATANTEAASGLASRSAEGIAARVERLGENLMRFALAGVIGWIGAMKFTAYEAEGITGLVQNSPLMSWVYEVLSVRGFGFALGTAELAIAALIVAGWQSPKLGGMGAALAVGMFATTLSFLATTPGVFEPSLGGFPALSIMPGQFLVKDVALLAVSVWLLGGSLKRLPAATKRNQSS